jgi:hypothetical protein
MAARHRYAGFSDAAAATFDIGPVPVKRAGRAGAGDALFTGGTAASPAFFIRRVGDPAARSVDPAKIDLARSPGAQIIAEGRRLGALIGGDKVAVAVASLLARRRAVLIRGTACMGNADGRDRDSDVSFRNIGTRSERREQQQRTSSHGSVVARSRSLDWPAAKRPRGADRACG